MTKKLLAGVAVVALVTAGIFLIPKNESATAAGVDRAEVETIVKEYILANPDVLIESLNKYQEKQQQDQMANAKKSVEAAQEDIKNNKTSPFAGNEDGDVTVVEFFDYNCGYCKHAFPSIAKLLEADKKVKVIFKELPILGPNSEIAARAALAVHFLDNDKYLPFHQKLMEFTGQKTEESIYALVKETGLDVEKVKEEAKSERVTKEITEVRNFAKSVNVNGTPAFIVGKQFIPGAIDAEGLKKAVEDARKDK
jgi:protein-disulfide isomerase